MKIEIKDREIREITASTIEDGNNFEIKREFVEKPRRRRERERRGKRCRPGLEREIEIMVEIKAGSGC